MNLNHELIIKKLNSIVKYIFKLFLTPYILQLKQEVLQRIDNPNGFQTITIKLYLVGR